MVLISLLWACSMNKSPIKSPSPHDVFMLSSLDQVDTRSSIPLPDSVQESLKSSITKRGLQIKTLQINDRFSMQRNSTQRANLYTERPLLLIETQAQFFSQLEGRFRWTVDVQLNLYTEKGELFTRNLSVPVFHQFHHQREKESLEAAQEQITRYLDRLLDDYVRGMQP